MLVYKDAKQGTWYVSFRYVDWTCEKKQKLKRGFRTKREALEYETEFKRKATADMDMELGTFVEIYFEDKKNELKQNTIQEKGLSKTYERMLQNQITALFNHAHKIYNLQNNPCNKVKKMGKSDGKDIFSTPKTDTSNRAIMIPEFLVEEIREYMEGHYGLPQDERLFPIVARTLQKRMTGVREKAGVKKIRIHDFRHSHVAYLINQGVQPLIIKERLGHKDIKITLNAYQKYKDKWEYDIVAKKVSAKVLDAACTELIKREEKDRTSKKDLLEI